MIGGHRGEALWRLVRERRAAPGGVVLAYHDVVARRGELTDLAVTVGQLRAHLAVLHRLGLRITSLDEIGGRLHAGQPVDGLAAITFDDALIGVHEHALPLLHAEELPATVFVVTACLGVDPHWWPGSRRACTATELAELAAGGLALASHTRSHPDLVRIEPPERERELAGSREDLAALTGDEVALLAYPYGHHDPEVRRSALAAGYTLACSFLNGRLGGIEDPLRLPRLTMGPQTSAARLALHLTRPASSWPDHQLDRVAGRS